MNISEGESCYGLACEPFKTLFLTKGFHTADNKKEFLFFVIEIVDSLVTRRHICVCYTFVKENFQNNRLDDCLRYDTPKRRNVRWTVSL